MNGVSISKKPCAERYVANGQRNFVPQLDVVLHGIAPQIDVAVLEPHLLIGQHGFAGEKRRLLRLVEDAQLLGDQLHLAGGDVLVYGVCNPLLGRARHGDDILIAQRFGFLVDRRIALFVEHNLSDTATVANIDKDEIAEIAPTVDPAHEHGLLARVRRTQCAAHVCTS